ncbi:MAG: hypothetical protein AAB089_01170, partial [Nitrospirota bacterium]
VSNISPPLMGGDEGEGEKPFNQSPPPKPPPSRRRELIGNPDAEHRGILLIKKRVIPISRF